MMGRNWMENEGLGLFRARRKNSRKWLEGYYVRVLETAGNGIPAVRHYIIFQKADGSGRMCRTEADPGMLCRCTDVRDKNRSEPFLKKWTKIIHEKLNGSSLAETTGFFPKKWSERTHRKPNKTLLVKATVSCGKDQFLLKITLQHLTNGGMWLQRIKNVSMYRKISVPLHYVL